MAYDALRKQKDGESLDGGGNPYEQTVSDYGATSPMPAGFSSGAIAPQSGASMQRATPGGAGQGAASPFGGDTGPTATGYVNFDRLYNANADVAQRESGKRADSAEKAGQQATAARTGAQGAFSGAVRTGTTQGPQAKDYEYATGQRGFKLPEPTGEKKVTENPDSVTETQEGLISTEMRPASGTPAPSVNDPKAPSQGDWRKSLEAGAKDAYSGPESLMGMDGYDELLQQTVAAQDLAKNPTTGLGQTDRDLLNASGRPRFADLQQKYGGLTKELDAANKASLAESAAARSASATAQSDYERLLSDYDVEQKRKADEEAAAKNASAIRIAAAPGVGSDSALGVTPDVKAAWEALTPEQTKAQHGAHKSFNEITGGSDRTLDGVLRGTYGVDGEDAAWIRENITPADWAAYQQAAGESPEAVLAWIQSVLGRKKK